MEYRHLDDPFRSIIPPRSDGTYLSIAYGFPDVATAARIFAGEEDGYAYPCVGLGNPTVRQFEKRVAQMESEGVGGFGLQFNLPGFDALATASGRSAIALSALYLATKDEKKTHFVSSPLIYGGTYSLFTEALLKLGIKCKMVADPIDISSWKKVISKKTAFVFLETIANPAADLLDLEQIAEIAHSNGSIVVADNTIPTSVAFKPLWWGADVVVHSASKAIIGNSSGLGGVIVADEKMIRELRKSWFSVLGPVMDPDCAKRMMDGLSTLPSRILRHSRNALTLAEVLSQRKEITNVYYPLLGNSLFFWRAVRFGISDGGPLLAFDLKGEIENAVRFINSLKVVIHATHLGHEKTIATHPASTTHCKVPKKVREGLKITDNFVRISAGCENPKDFQLVIEDIEKALEN